MPPSPPGDGHPEHRDPAGDPAAGGGLPRPAADDNADLFTASPDLSDDTPTVITRSPPRPPSSEDVFSGTLRGRRLAHFELIEPIGVGGMAAVIRARDLQLERQVALKILPPEMATDEENVRRFHQEARAAAKLDHENIARVFFCGEDQKLHFIAFEFVEGQNLRTLIERRGRLPVAETIRTMLQVATGLAHAAERGVIHRDIKPSNIIISPHGRAKLVDMGLARQLDPRHDLGLTQSGVTLGTFDYISPEQALEPRDADVRSDIYSLGCTFYHALTGQPPVPEGTAARKLHHHQHVAPVDPRQLNPDIPDEVAAILARMMAKDPKDRYQRPEHLVQHLMQVAQKLGAVSEVPDGMLFVDAPLPSPPRPRPLLLAAAAALALVALVVLLGQTGPRPTMPTGNRGRGGDRAGAEATPTKPPQPADAGPPTEAPGKAQELPAPPAVQAARRSEAATAQAAAEFLQAAPKDQTSYLDLTGNLELRRLETPGAGLVYDGGERGVLVIGPKNPEERPTISLPFDAGRQVLPSLWAALTVKSGLVKVHDVRFEVDAAAAPDSIMAALYRQGGEVDVENCEFVQKQPSQQGHSRLSAVEVTGPATTTGHPAVNLLRCCFLAGPDAAQAQAVVPGQNAITMTGGGLLQMSQCAFGPHAAVVAFQGAEPQGTDRPPTLADAQAEIDHCSVLLAGAAAAVRLERVARCRLTVNSCLFSRPDQGQAEGGPAAVLIRQADEPVNLTWAGSENRYHNLEAFWAQPEGVVIGTWEEFQNAVVQGMAPGDVDAQVLPDSPWNAEDPLALLDAENARKLREAFQVKTDLRHLRLLPEGKGTHLVGVEQPFGSKPYTEGLRPLDEARPLATRVVTPPDPDGKLRRRPGDYPSLEAALREARPGDTILLRCNGPYRVEPIRVRSTADVTIKPFPDCRPVLTLDPDTDEEDAALFRLHDGKLRLAGLEFALHPARANFRTQAVVAAVGDGECSFSDCVLTLEKAYDARLAAVTLADLPGLRKTDERPAGRRPSFKFHDCFVRGDGDLVAARVSRQFELEVDNALVALAGSLVNVDLGDEPAPDAAEVAVELSRATAYLGGHLLRLHAKDARALLPFKFKPVQDCLFVSATGSNSLIHIDGPEVSDDRLRTLLTWDGQHNAYTDFTQPGLIDQAPEGGAMAMPFTRDKWKEFTSETGAVFDRVRFRDRPAADTPLSRVTPARFRIKADEMVGPDMLSFGADLDKLPKVAAPADTMRMTPPEEE
jgi:hypothetical protein